MRNRYVQSTGMENEVLLDENLNESGSLAAGNTRRITNNSTAAHIAPFFLHEHSKRILRGALNSDSKFLADANVVDYSFLVGVDSVGNELVVGIIGEPIYGRSAVYGEGN